MLGDAAGQWQNSHSRWRAHPSELSPRRQPACVTASFLVLPPRSQRSPQPVPSRRCFLCGRVFFSPILRWVRFQPARFGCSASRLRSAVESVARRRRFRLPRARGSLGLLVSLRWFFHPHPARCLRCKAPRGLFDHLQAGFSMLRPTDPTWPDPTAEAAATRMPRSPRRTSWTSCVMLPEEPAWTTSGGSACCGGGDPILVLDAPTATSPNRPLAEIASTEPISPACAGALPVLSALPGVVARCTEVRLHATLRPMLRQFKHVPPRWEQPRTEVLSCPTLCATSLEDWDDESLLVASPPRYGSGDPSGVTLRSAEFASPLPSSPKTLGCGSAVAVDRAAASPGIRGTRVLRLCCLCHWRKVAPLRPLESEEPSGCAVAAWLRRLCLGHGIRRSRAAAWPDHRRVALP
jgi:hypothetical protein